MQDLLVILQSPWPWYVSGPLIGLMVPLFILIGSRSFGISQNLEHLCAITQPRSIQVKFFKYDWRVSKWSLVFMLGVAIGGYLAGNLFANPDAIQLSEAALVISLSIGVAGSFGGILIGFGTRYASGCTSGHAVTGLATFQVKSLYAVLGIFSGGIFSAYLIVPHIRGLV